MPTPIETALESVDWKELSPDEISTREDAYKAGGLPYATHEGTLKIGEIEIECARLNTGQTVIVALDPEDCSHD